MRNRKFDTIRIRFNFFRRKIDGKIVIGRKARLNEIRQMESKIRDNGSYAIS